MIHAFGFVSYNTSIFQQRESFWNNFGRVVKNHPLSYSYEDDNEPDYSESSTDKIDMLSKVLSYLDTSVSSSLIF